MVQDAIIKQDFGVGEVLSKSFNIWIQNLVPFAILGIIFNLPVVPVTYLVLKDVLPLQRQVLSGQAVPTSIPPDQFSGFFWDIAASSFATMVCYQLLTAAIAYGVINRLRGQPISVGACFSQALKRFIPVIIASLLATILIWLASLLFVIPGIIVALNFWVAIPVCMAEELGPVASLSRAKALARGYRWKILGIVLVAGVTVAVIQQILGFVFRLTIPLGASLTTAISVTLGLGLINQAIFATLFAAIATCVYYYLRVAKEGADIDQIAAVFD